MEHKEVEKMKVLDVGGNVKPWTEATHIIDILPEPKDCKRHYVQQDICDTPWPYKDKEFDYVYCSNTLEDVKDPIRVCKEIIRVGKAGKIIVPSVYLECRRGVDTWPGANLYAGFVHHRWLCIQKEGKLLFVQKTPITHVYDWTRGLNDEEIHRKAFLKIDWRDSFEAFERVYADYRVLYNLLKEAFQT